MHNFWYKIGIFSLFIAANAGLAHAATLNFSPASGSFAVGQTFPVKVYVSSPSQAMNASSAVVSFPADKLQVISVSQTGSIINQWVQQPDFSNVSGQVNFEGVVLNPGFTGSFGQIIIINFKAKSAGSAALSFSSGQILANDGSGTDILTNLGTANFNLTSAPAKTPEIPPATPAATIASPKISSPTHSDQEKWYADANPKFTWTLPKGVTSVKLSYDKYPDSQPTVAYSPAISEKQVKNIEDGIWYLHVQFLNNEGASKVSHFKTQIDTQKPDHFNITQKTEEVQDSTFGFTFDASDKLSGIDHYEIKIDSADQKNLPGGTNSFETPALAAGQHTIIVKAVDKAGNFLESSAQFIAQSSLQASQEKITPPPKNYAILIITSLILLIAFLIIIIFVRQGSSNLRQKVRKETIEAQKDLCKSYEKTKEEIKEIVSKVDQVPGFTPEERRAYDKIEEVLKANEEKVEKELKNIEDSTK